MFNEADLCDVLNVPIKYKLDLFVSIVFSFFLSSVWFFWRPIFIQFDYLLENRKNSISIIYIIYINLSTKKK